MSIQQKHSEDNSWFGQSIGKCRDTGMAITLILLIIMIFVKGWNLGPLIATLVLVLTMTVPKIFSPFAKLWFAFAHLLGTVMSKIILGVIFFIILLPVAGLRKFLGKDSMQLKKWKSGDESAFRVRDHTFKPEDISRPF